MLHAMNEIDDVVLESDDFSVYQTHIEKIIAKFPKAFNKKKPLPLTEDTEERLKAARILKPEQVDACMNVWRNRLEYIREVAFGVYYFDINGVVDRPITKREKLENRDTYNERNSELSLQRKANRN